MAFKKGKYIQYKSCWWTKPISWLNFICLRMLTSGKFFERVQVEESLVWSLKSWPELGPSQYLDEVARINRLQHCSNFSNKKPVTSIFLFQDLILRRLTTWLSFWKESNSFSNYGFEIPVHFVWYIHGSKNNENYIVWGENYYQKHAASGWNEGFAMNHNELHDSIKFSSLTSLTILYHVLF